MAYTIQLNGATVDTKKRIDHAQNAFNSIKLKPGERKEILDAQGTTIKVQSRKAAGEPKASKPRDNGDEVAQSLRGLTVSEIATKARELVERANITELRRSRKLAQIKSAEARAVGKGYDVANPGSARMSLGLMIRALTKAEAEEAKVEAEAA